MGWTAPKTMGAEPGISSDWNTYVRDNLNFLKANIALGTAVELTIATGEITKTKAFHKIDTEANAASDDLDIISGGSTGDIIILRAEHTDRTVVIKNGTGNIICAADRSLDNTKDIWIAIFDGTNWLEIAFADNAA